jgi:hypothetical protein
LAIDYSDIPDFNTFKRAMADKEKANQLYKTLITDAYKLPTTFEMFYTNINKESALDEQGNELYHPHLQKNILQNGIALKRNIRRQNRAN